MSLLKNFATVGSATLLSRILGFVRDILMAGWLGTGPVADAFLVAFRLPNLFRRLFAEGAFNSAFIPLFAKSLETEGESGARKFASEILAVFIITLLVVTLVAELMMPQLIHLLAPGFTDDREKFELAVWLTRITFPYLICMSVIAFLSGILNSFGKFAAAAFTPVLLNVVLISSLALIGWFEKTGTIDAGVWLSWGVFIAGFVQLASLVIAIKKLGFSVRIQRPRITPAVRRLLVLGVPGVIAGGITQINILIGTIIASFQDGAVSYLYYADRIYQLPLGIVGIAIGVVLLPELSRQLRTGSDADVQNSINRSLEFAMLLTIPASVALVIMPDTILSILFERGRFTSEDTTQTANALGAFALGLPAFVLIKVFSPAYFAREDTRTPMIFAGVSMFVNVVGSLILFPYIQHVGIAISTTLAGWVNVALLWWTLSRRGQFLSDGQLRKCLPLMCLASLCMGAMLWLALPYGQVWLAHSGLLFRILALGGLVFGGLIVFGSVCLLTGVIDHRRITGIVRSKK
ncbi:MAG: murein biosynthesis integral membrane protein MurJ [Cohaesibacteraceae bacterium]|nr:murein biosynthesis integral membrane protein MurJ [Cohaesibacteraceae bacterium]